MVAVTWSKLSDDFPDDCWTLSDAAFRLHVEGLCWSNRKLLDCRIPKDDLRRFAKTPGAVAELLAVGWWSDDGDAYVIRHHADYQRTREQVVAQQEANRRNGRRGGRPPKPKPPTKTALVGESPSETGTQRDGTGRGSYGSEDQGHGESWPRVIPPGSAAGPPPADESPRDLDSAVGRVDLGRVSANGWATATRPTDATGRPVPAGQLSLNCDDCAEPLDPELIDQGMTTCVPCARGDG